MNSIEALENLSITFDEGGYSPTTLGAKEGHFYDVFKYEYKIIEKDLKRLKKLEKAIEILKDKKVSIGLLLKNNTLNQYNRVRHLYDADFLIQEEYELLKEVLGNDTNKSEE